MTGVLRAGVIVGAVAVSGCQSFGAFSQPRTLPAGEVRLGASMTYHDFQVTGERQQVADFNLACQVGVTDRTELDLLAYSGGADARVKHNFLGDGSFDLSLSSGVGLFSAFQNQESSAYIPLDLVGGYRVADDISIFVGPKLYGAVALSTPGLGAGFNGTDFGALAGGVLGVAMESKHLTFVPQVTYMAPLIAGTQGQVIQFVLGVGTNIR